MKLNWMRQSTNEKFSVQLILSLQHFMNIFLRLRNNNSYECEINVCDKFSRSVTVDFLRNIMFRGSVKSSSIIIIFNGFYGLFIYTCVSLFYYIIPVPSTNMCYTEIYVHKDFFKIKLKKSESVQELFEMIFKLIRP